MMLLMMLSFRSARRCLVLFSFYFPFRRRLQKASFGADFTFTIF